MELKELKDRLAYLYEALESYDYVKDYKVVNEIYNEINKVKLSIKQLKDK